MNWLPCTTRKAAFHVAISTSVIKKPMCGGIFIINVNYIMLLTTVFYKLPLMLILNYFIHFSLSLWVYCCDHHEVPIVSFVPFVLWGPISVGIPSLILTWGPLRPQLWPPLISSWGPLRAALISSHVTASAHPTFHCFQLPLSRSK